MAIVFFADDIDSSVPKIMITLPDDYMHLQSDINSTTDWIEEHCLSLHSLNTPETVLFIYSPPPGPEYVAIAIHK